MTPAEHHAEAERLIEAAMEERERAEAARAKFRERAAAIPGVPAGEAERLVVDRSQEFIAEAQVHALLALPALLGHE